MRLPKRLQNFAGIDSADPPPNRPPDLHFYSLQVPLCGYQWIESAVPSEFPPTRSDILGGAPYMVFCGSLKEQTIPARTYYPFAQPGLFLKFAGLNLDPDSILTFAGAHGWIGATGAIDVDCYPGIEAVGITVWQSEIQLMNFACRLWEAIGKRDRKWLQQFFRWPPDRFDVRFSYRLQGKEIGPAVPRGRVPNWAVNIVKAAKGRAPTVLAEEPTGRRAERLDRQEATAWLIPDHDVNTIRKHGWKRGDIIAAAHLAIRYLVNPRLSRLCAPQLYLNKDRKLVWHLTPKNLLGCLWMQFARAITGLHEFRLCSECNEPLDMTGRRSTYRIHETCSRNKRMQQWRASKRSKAQPVQRRK